MGEAGRHTANHLFPPNPETSELTVVCRRSDYSASLIARAVEDAEAHLLNLNVTSADAGPESMAVDLRVSHRNAGSVARSLERHGFEVTAIHSGYDLRRQTDEDRLDNLLRQINV